LCVAASMTADRGIEPPLEGATGQAAGSVADVEGVAQRTVELSALDLDEPSDRPRVEHSLRDGEEVVAGDDAGLGQAFFGADLDLGTYVSDRAGDRCAGDRAQHRDGCVSGQDAHRPATCRRPEVSPIELAAGYHSGAVSDASRLAASTNAGSCGWRRYAS
jgi:hypothetical protein